MKGQVKKADKEKRLDLIMTRQQEVSRDVNKKKIGRTYEVLVEGLGEEGYYGRSYEMAPEIDGLVFIDTDRDLVVGSYVNVKITEAAEYDLKAELA